MIHAGLVVFEGTHAGVAVKCGPFNPQPFRDWLELSKTPEQSLAAADVEPDSGGPS